MFAMPPFTGSTNTATAKPEVVIFHVASQVGEIPTTLSMFSRTAGPLASKSKFLDVLGLLYRKYTAKPEIILLVNNVH